MKTWKSEEIGTGVWRLFLSEDAYDRDVEDAVLYFENVKGEWQYNFSTYIMGRSYNHCPLKVETLEDAKKEVEEWLIKAYKNEIESLQNSISFYREKLKFLDKVG